MQLQYRPRSTQSRVPALCLLIGGLPDVARARITLASGEGRVLFFVGAAQFEFDATRSPFLCLVF